MHGESDGVVGDYSLGLSGLKEEKEARADGGVEERVGGGGEEVEPRVEEGEAAGEDGPGVDLEVVEENGGGGLEDDEGEVFGEEEELAKAEGHFFAKGDVDSCMLPSHAVDPDEAGGGEAHEDGVLGSTQ